MTQEKWQNIVGLIKDKFGVEDEGREELADIPSGSVEFIIFSGPLGRMRLEYTSKPVVLDKKSIGSKRIGSEATVQYIYSDTEMSNTFKAYKWEDEEWVEMEQEAAGAFSV
jgi:hypothetical protein